MLRVKNYYHKKSLRGVGTSDRVPRHNPLILTLQQQQLAYHITLAVNVYSKPLQNYDSSTVKISWQSNKLKKGAASATWTQQRQLLKEWFLIRQIEASVVDSASVQSAKGHKFDSRLGHIQDVDLCNKCCILSLLWALWRSINVSPQNESLNRAVVFSITLIII